MPPSLRTWQYVHFYCTGSRSAGIFSVPSSMPTSLQAASVESRLEPGHDALQQPLASVLPYIIVGGHRRDVHPPILPTGHQYTESLVSSLVAFMQSPTPESRRTQRLDVPGLVWRGEGNPRGPGALCPRPAARSARPCPRPAPTFHKSETRASDYNLVSM